MYRSKYHFAQPSSDESPFGVTHASELPFVAVAGLTRSQDIDVAKKMNAYYTSCTSPYLLHYLRLTREKQISSLEILTSSYPLPLPTGNPTPQPLNPNSVSLLPELVQEWRRTTSDEKLVISGEVYLGSSSTKSTGRKMDNGV